jgi:hypothetical protein
MQTESDCRVCHSSGVPNRHHVLYGKPIAQGSHVPYPDADGNGSPDATYSCISCHGQAFTLQRNCMVCHTGASPHHASAAAKARHCKSCHGSLVDDFDDGHYIPTYAPSLVTPTPVGGDGLPLNSRGKGAGACDYCHDRDNLVPPVIRNPQDLHHYQGFDCMWCHNVHGGEAMRKCESCHGPNSLHNIQVDSPKAPTGAIVVGGEDAGYGHVGKDAGPGESDCWGCHGFAMASAPGSGPLIPTVYNSDRATLIAGTATTVVLAGAAFTNTMGNTLYEATVSLTAGDGSTVTLQPDIIVNEGQLAVTIPANTASGNYGLKALKAQFASNPVVVSVVPQAKITRATALQKTVTIAGSGFAAYAKGSATAVAGTTASGKTVRGTIVSWTDDKIVADFTAVPERVTVNSIFGRARAKVKVLR